MTISPFPPRFGFMLRKYFFVKTSKNIDVSTLSMFEISIYRYIGTSIVKKKKLGHTGKTGRLTCRDSRRNVAATKEFSRARRHSLVYHVYISFIHISYTYLVCIYIYIYVLPWCVHSRAFLYRRRDGRGDDDVSFAYIIIGDRIYMQMHRYFRISFSKSDENRPRSRSFLWK